MIYSRADKVEQYLAHHNIKQVITSKGGQISRFILTNLHTGQDYSLDIQNPLYNVLSKVTTPEKFEFLEHSIKEHEALFKRMMFDDMSTMEWFTENFLQSDYYKRYGTLEHEAGKKQSSEYFSYLELKDVERIKELAGFKDNEIVSVHGNFFKMDDNTLRFMFKPTTPVVENINEVFFANSFVFETKGWQYPIYYIIYTVNGSDDVMFEWSNLLTNSVTNKGLVTVNLTQMFGNNWSTILEDMRTLNGYESEWFIANTLFTCAIFKNSPNGIFRYIPINFTVQFFNIMFTNMDIQSERIEYTHKNGRKDLLDYGFNFSDPNAVFDTMLETDPDYLRNHPIDEIYKEDRLVPQSDMKQVEFLDQILSLSSTAEFYNDVLFNINDTDFQFPVYLISEEKAYGRPADPLGTLNWENRPLLDPQLLLMTE